MDFAGLCAEPEELQRWVYTMSHYPLAPTSPSSLGSSLASMAYMKGFWNELVKAKEVYCYQRHRA